MYLFKWNCWHLGLSPFLGWDAGHMDSWRGGELAGLLSSQWGFSVPQTDKANIAHQNMLKHSFPFLKQPKTRQIAYSANLGNTFSLSCFQKAATLGLSQPPVSSAFFVANFKAFEEGFRFCIESLQSNLLLEHLYVGPLYRCSINNMVQNFSFSPKIPLHRRTLHCARRKSTSSMHRDLRRSPEYGYPFFSFFLVWVSCPKGGGDLRLQLASAPSRTY